jgi:NitT/TauT family transport system ATP-binding protein
MTIMDRATAMISIKGLDMVYAAGSGRPVRALEGICLEVPRGEFVSLVGPSGCGKSTLLKLVAGLYRATRGELGIGGKPVSGPSRDIGMVFQSPVLLPWRTVLRNVLLPVEVRGQETGSFHDRALSLLAAMGLEEFHDRYPHELSGGMQQRVGIARALIQDPAILLMDEPFAALDAMTREGLNVELLRIWQETGKTIVFVTHSILEAVFLSSRVIVMSNRPGRVLAAVEVDLPVPRTLDMMGTPAFGRLASHIRSLFGDRCADTPINADTPMTAASASSATVAQ